MDNATRILMTADAVGGVWQYATQLAARFVQNGAPVMLATMGPAPSASQRAEAAAAGVVLRTSDFALEWMPDAWRDVDQAGVWLLELAREFSPDVVHLNGYCHASLPWDVPVAVVAHSCVCSWWQGVHGHPPPAEWRQYTTRVARGLAAADTIVTPSHAMKRALVKFYGVGGNARVIPNGREQVPISARPKEPLIFAAGRVWDPAKNLVMLGALSQEVPWPVVIAGQTSGSGVTAPAVSGATCLGPVSTQDVAAWMQRAAIYAFPARYEPFGLSVLEAALAGCALVLGDIASLRENWDGVAYFVRPDDREGLRSAVCRLIDDADQRHAMGAAARRRAERFSASTQATAYDSLYKEMIATHGRTAHSSRAH